MDVQLKRGILDVCVLAAIKDEDSYGYKIIKDLRPYANLSESTLYTILKRLENAKMLEELKALKAQLESQKSDNTQSNE